jgi:hypothetical protein
MLSIQDVQQSWQKYLLTCSHTTFSLDTLPSHALRKLYFLSYFFSPRQQHEQKMVNGEQHVNGLSNGHSDKHKSSSHKSSSKDKHRDKERSKDHKSSKSSHR